MIPNDSWLAERRRRLEKLRRDKHLGLVDKDIEDIIDTINKHESYFTTSSCSGRIIVVASTAPGDKPGALILGKWHRKISVDELREAVKKIPGNAVVAWASAQGPLIHVAARDLESAKTLLDAGLTAGFKYSCIQALRNMIIVEIRSAERIDIPLVFQGMHVEIDLGLVTLILNYYLSLGKSRLERLRRAIALRLGSP